MLFEDFKTYEIRNELPICGLEKINMGTTIMGLKYDNGIILCADSRTSSFPVVANKVAKKITPICDKVFMCRAGSAADTQNAARLLRSYIPLNQIKNTNNAYNLSDASVRSVANIARLINISANVPISADYIIGGIDSNEGAQLYNVTLDGAIFERAFICSGSGSTYITALCDELIKPRMSKNEALTTCTKLVNYAIMRDKSSGGIIRYVIIDNDEGVIEDYISSVNVMKLENKVQYLY